MEARALFGRKQTHKHRHTHTHTQPHTHTHTHTQTHTHPHTHTHTHTANPKHTESGITSEFSHFNTHKYNICIHTQFINTHTHTHTHINEIGRPHHTTPSH